MPPPRSEAALLMVFCLLLGLPTQGWPSAPASLGKKDAKQVHKAKDAPERLLVYTAMAQRNATTLWSCLSPWGRLWPEAGPGAIPPSSGEVVGCQGVLDMLAALDCVEEGLREEMPAWRRVRTTADIALRKAQEQLERAESALGYAADDAQRPVLGLPPAVAHQIKSKHHEFEDLESEISALVPMRSPPSAAP